MNNNATAEEFSIIRECVNGRVEKYALLVEKYKVMAFTVAYRMLGDTDTANDMAQESFVSAYVGLRDFKYNAKFSSWLYSIVLNKCRDHLRDRKEAVPVDDLAEYLPAKGPDPEQAASSQQTRDAVQKALDLLPEQYREVIILKHLEELGYEEIAEILGEKVIALKVRAHRGREMLKEHLENMGVVQ